MNESASPSRTYVYVRAYYVVPHSDDPGDISFAVHEIVVRAEDVIDGDWEAAAYAKGGDLPDDDHAPRGHSYWKSRGWVSNDVVYQVRECGTVHADAQRNPPLPAGANR